MDDPNTQGLNAQGQGQGQDPDPGQGQGSNFDMNQFMTEGWKECIPEDLRDRAEWSRVNNVQDVFKNYIAGQQTISKSVRIPDATSSAEEITAFYTKLGKPASAAEYDFEYQKEEGSPFPSWFRIPAASYPECRQPHHHSHCQQR